MLHLKEHLLLTLAAISFVGKSPAWCPWKGCWKPGIYMKLPVYYMWTIKSESLTLQHQATPMGRLDMVVSLHSLLQALAQPCSLLTHP